MGSEKSSSAVVVGVDGSQASRDALAWAARQAELTGTELHVVRVWRQPSNYGYPVDYSDADFESDARKDLDEILDEVLGSDPKVPVITHVVEGHPAPVLVETAQGADLLVVGSRGHGGFAGMLLGSVSTHCAQHADCPVVIFRHPPT